MIFLCTLIWAILLLGTFIPYFTILGVLGTALKFDAILMIYIIKLVTTLSNVNWNAFGLFLLSPND